MEENKKQPFEEIDTVLSSKKNEKISLTLEELKGMIVAAVSTAVQQSSETSAKMIAEAMLESRKPYIDPKQVENEANMRDSMRKAQERMNAEIKESQAVCQHLQGSNALSDFPSPFNLTSIIPHQLDTGELVGVCTNCIKVFRMGDPDYKVQMARKSGNRMSRSGQRFFADPIAVIQKGQK